MIGVLCAFLTAAFFTLALGIPIATRLARVQVWRRPAIADVVGERGGHHGRLFEPVDFGPVKMKWPSEIPREGHGVPEPPWPSAGWDDEHFGRKGLSAEQLRARSQDAAVVKPTPQPRKASHNPVDPVPKRKPKRKKTKERKRQAPPSEPSPQPEPEYVIPPAAESGGAADLPDKWAVEEMVSELGLAGTVQHLMRTQGWDFKTAAGWLGRIRRG